LYFIDYCCSFFINMSDFSKRPEVTISTMGKVHNPSGEGVRAISNEVQSRAAKVAAKAVESTTQEESAARHIQHNSTDHDTKVKETGSSRRNVIRKKGEANAQLHNSKNKKQGGTGKGKWGDNMEDVSDAPAVLDEKDPNYDD
jgi:hypothetical protein